jgi:hypothetical protein
MTTDSDAFEIVQTLPGLNSGEQQYLLTVARGEGFYGLGWSNPGPLTINESLKFGIDPRAGAGSNNWGAEQGTGSAGSFPHVDFGWMVADVSGKPTDKHWTGSGPRAWGPYVAKYKKHMSATEGAASVARVLLKPNVRAAILTGDLRAIVNAQHDNGYFELDPNEYLRAVVRNYNALTANLKWSPLLQVGGSAPIAAVPLVLPGLESSESPPSCSGEASNLPEGGFLRNQEFSVPGIQDGKKV